VEHEVQKLLPHGKAHASTVAKTIHLSVRTLSRRLAQEGTTFAEVVDQVRRTLALQYLKEPGFSVSHIAWLLGYEQASSFNHAFQRWTGRSPSASRKPKSLDTMKPHAPEALIAAVRPSAREKALSR
jgi:AraC-like DNA-binding protein